MKLESFITVILLTVAPTVLGQQCPELTPKEWAQRFISYADGIDYNYDQIKSEYESCEAVFNLNGVKSCAERIRNHAEVRNVRYRNGHSMGWEISDTEYTNSAPEGYLDLPPELQDGVPDNIDALAAQKGWTLLRYDSRTVGNPPNGSLKRLLILVEEDKVDKWIQFTLPERPGYTEQLVDFIAMEKPTGANDQATPYFTQFWRDSNGRNPQRRTSYDNCYACHPNGMRELSPEPGSYSAGDYTNLKYMQEKMADYTRGRGGVDWGDALSPEHYGPPMGKEQGCVRCHNNGTSNHEYSRGAITDRHSSGHIGHKMYGDMSMPMTSVPAEKEFLDWMEKLPTTISEQQRQGLQDYLGGFRDNSKFQATVDYMKNIGELSDSQYNIYNNIINGSGDYPGCFGEEDCFPGMTRYQDYYEEMMDSYQGEKRAWLVESCQAILDGTVDLEAVHDGDRAGEESESGASGNQGSGAISQ